MLLRHPSAVQAAAPIVRPTTWDRLRAARSSDNPPLAMVTLTVMLGLIMAIIDASIVNVALDTMAGNLGSSTDEIAWVVTSYILANVVVMPLNGWLTATFGRKKFYATCLVVFTLSSLLCGLSTNVWELVFFRVLQGLGGGALQPTAQSILFESYPPEKRGSAMAIFGLGAMVGPALGPTLGGYIVDNASWPLIFFINIPIGIVALAMTSVFIRDPKYIERTKGGIDWVSLSLMTAGISAMQYVLERGQHDDWFDSPTIATLTVVSVVSLVWFIVRQLRAINPLVDLRVFRSRSFTAGNIIGVVSGFGLFGLNLILPLFFQGVLHFSAWQTGVALLPGAIATALSMPIAGRLVNILDARITIGIGMAMFGASTWFMGYLDQTAGFWDIFWPRTIQGFALGFIFVPLSTVTLAGIPRGEMSSATGVYTLIRQLGGSLGIALLTTLLTRQEAISTGALAAGVTLASPDVRSMMSDPSTRAGAVSQLDAMVESNATVISYDYLFRLSGILFAISIPTVLLLRRPPKAKSAEPVAME